jgi:hypothetical protein
MPIISQKYRITPILEKRFSHLKESVLKSLRVVHTDGHMKYSSGAISRATGVPARLIQFWRTENGIRDCTVGKCRPTPEVGQVLE